MTIYFHIFLKYLIVFLLLYLIEVISEEILIATLAMPLTVIIFLLNSKYTPIKFHKTIKMVSSCFQTSYTFNTEYI